jgi:hypothetical protein
MGQRQFGGGEDGQGFTRRRRPGIAAAPVWGLALWLGWASAGPAQASAAQTSAPAEERSAAEVLAAFDALEPRHRRGVADYLALDLSHADRFQLQLVRFVLDTAERSSRQFPPAPDLRWFDPQEHAPAQPIPRRLLPADSSAARTMAERMLRAIPERRLVPGYAYDWGRRQVVELPRADDPRRVVENALAGFSPDLDLAEALILELLDDGSQTAVLAAFDHRYTNREGEVYPALSLYDAWASGVEMEMPDVDVLGLLHTLVPRAEWHRKWVAPVPNSEHDRLYGRVGECFLPAKRFRSLREAAARCYLISSPVLRDGFGRGNIDAFHAFWETIGSELSRASTELPGVGDDWTRFLSDWVRRLGKERELLERSRVRASTLAEDEAFVRARLLAVMEDLDAFAPPTDPTR